MSDDLMGLLSVGVDLADYQLSIATTGLVLGAGTDYIVHGWEGAGVPDLRTSDTDKPFDHGVFMGPEYLSSRQVTIPITIRGADADEVQARLDALIAAWYFDARAQSSYDTHTTLSVKLPGQVGRHLRGRPRRLTADTSRLITGKVTAELEFFAGDPRWYATTAKEETLGISEASTGFGFPLAFDYGFGTGTSGLRQIINDGTVGAAPVLRLDGPITNATLLNETTGESLSITYTLGSGEFLIVDFAAKSVMLQGTASRYYAKSGTWWELAPGINDVRLIAGAGSGNASISWQDAWL